jgi:hypothetical protein
MEVGFVNICMYSISYYLTETFEAERHQLHNAKPEVRFLRMKSNAGIPCYHTDSCLLHERPVCCSFRGISMCRHGQALVFHHGREREGDDTGPEWRKCLQRTPKPRTDLMIKSREQREHAHIYQRLLRTGSLLPPVNAVIVLASRRFGKEWETYNHHGHLRRGRHHGHGHLPSDRRRRRHRSGTSRAGEGQSAAWTR